MGDWRYYVQRASSGLWLDTNCQLAEVNLAWALSAPNAGKATVLGGLNATPTADDGRRTWGKWDTLLYAEEDEQLSWVGICNAAYPKGGDLNLEFIGTSGWLQRVPFTGDYASWEVNVYTVVRMLINHAKTYPGHLDIMPSSNNSAYSIGDPQPPARPVQPARLSGQTVAEYQASTRYKTWLAAATAWDTAYKEKKPYSLGWWEGQYVGEEMDQLAKEFDFEYREAYSWSDRNTLAARFDLVLADDMIRRREDIAFVDGTNLAQLLAPKDGDEAFANHVIALGAGEGRKMVRVNVGQEDGRLYQAEFANYKAVRDVNRLRNLASADLRFLSNTEYAIDTVAVWDVPGYASISTLQVGDEVKLQSANVQPELDSWRRVVEINRQPEESVAVVSLEYAL
jgi:hypothetical protein